MPIERVTAAAFAVQINTEILALAPSTDVAYGPVPDVIVVPMSVVLERQNARTRLLSQMLSLSDPSVFDGLETDLNGIVYNELMTRVAGAASTASLQFSVAAKPTSDIVVARGFPVAGQPDESGTAVTFLTTETRTLPAATAVQNLQTGRYELLVPAVSSTRGTGSRVAARRINTPLRPITGGMTITNPEAASGGRDLETNTELIERYLVGVAGRQLGVPTGLRRSALSDFPSVVDMSIVRPGDPLLTRSGDDAGAVDTWVRGTESLSATENLPFYGVGQLIPVSFPPLVSVLAVSNAGTGVPYVEGTDYAVVVDDGAYGRSTLAVDGIRFLAGGAAPLVGEVVAVVYRYENLVRSLQTGYSTDDSFVLGRDLLWRRARGTSIIHSANLKVRAGYSSTVVAEAVRTALIGPQPDRNAGFINATIPMGTPVEGSDIQGVVRQISGVDNYVITRLTLSTVTSGVGDIPLNLTQYPVLADADFTLSVS